MDLSQKTINEFKDIFKRDYGKELTDGEAQEYANSLLRLVEVVTQIESRKDEKSETNDSKNQ
jgi:hypothetical protein